MSNNNNNDDKKYYELCVGDNKRVFYWKTFKTLKELKIGILEYESRGYE